MKLIIHSKHLQGGHDQSTHDPTQGGGGAGPAKTGNKFTMEQRKTIAEAIGQAISASHLGPNEVKHVKYKKYKHGFVLQDIDGFLGNFEGSMSNNEISKLGLTPESFEGFLTKYGASKIRPQRRARGAGITYSIYD